jgi:hypothetical protein
MRKSLWIEVLEWSVFAFVLLFVMGVLAMRGEITSAAQENPNAPIQSLDE